VVEVFLAVLGGPCLSNLTTSHLAHGRVMVKNGVLQADSLSRTPFQRAHGAHGEQNCVDPHESSVTGAWCGSAVRCCWL
jgi:hypothetical protein